MGRKKNQSSNCGLRKSTEITADTPLKATEQKFITEYLRTANKSYSALTAKLCDIHGKEVTMKNAVGAATYTLSKPNVQAEIKRIMDELREESIATAQEVMAYFTEVMRGNLKDQFGLEASLSERTKAAQELAKRTIDIENSAKKNSDAVVNVKIDWSRDKNEEDNNDEAEE